MERKEKPCFTTCTNTEYSSCHDNMLAFSQETDFLLGWCKHRSVCRFTEKRKFLEPTLGILPRLNGWSGLAVAELTLHGDL